MGRRPDPSWKGARLAEAVFAAEVAEAVGREEQQHDEDHASDDGDHRSDPLRCSRSPVSSLTQGSPRTFYVTGGALRSRSGHIPGRRRGPTLPAMRPETNYARNGDAHIAYQVVGDGPLDILYVSSFLSNIEMQWEHPAMSAFSRRIGRFARLILFDRRGNGMSDGAGGAAPVDEQGGDVRAVLDAAGSRRPAVLAINEGASLALLFAAGHPEAVRALVLAAPVPCVAPRPGYEWPPSAAEREDFLERLVANWGLDRPENPWIVMGGEGPQERAAMARFQRLAAGPGDALATLRQGVDTDVRGVMPSIQCPTLVMRRAGDDFVDARHALYTAEHVPGARYVELDGDGAVWAGDPEQAGREIE